MSTEVTSERSEPVQVHSAAADSLAASATPIELQRLNAAVQHSATLPDYVKHDVGHSVEALTDTLAMPASVQRANAASFFANRIRAAVTDDEKSRHLADRTLETLGMATSPWAFIALVLLCCIGFEVYLDSGAYLLVAPSLLLPLLLAWLSLRSGPQIVLLLLAIAIASVGAVSVSVGLVELNLGIRPWTLVVGVALAVALLPRRDGELMSARRWPLVRWPLLLAVCAAFVFDPIAYEDESGTISARFVPLTGLALLILAVGVDWRALMVAAREILGYRDATRHIAWTVAGATGLVLACVFGLSLDESIFDDGEILGVLAALALFAGVLLSLVRRHLALLPLALFVCLMIFLLGVEEGDAYARFGVSPSLEILYALLFAATLFGYWRIAVLALGLVLLGELVFEWWEALAVPSAPPPPATTSPSDIEQIIVTAQRRGPDPTLVHLAHGVGAIAAGWLVEPFARDPTRPPTADRLRLALGVVLALGLSFVMPKLGGFGEMHLLLYGGLAFWAARLLGARAIVAAPCLLSAVLVLTSLSGGEEGWVINRLSSALSVAFICFAFSLAGVLSRRLSAPGARTAT